jgi:hypothetical protein
MHRLPRRRQSCGCSKHIISIRIQDLTRKRILACSGEGIMAGSTWTAWRVLYPLIPCQIDSGSWLESVIPLPSIDDIESADVG